MKLLIAIFILVAAIVFSSCGGEKKKNDSVSHGNGVATTSSDTIEIGYIDDIDTTGLSNAIGRVIDSAVVRGWPMKQPDSTRIDLLPVSKPHGKLKIFYGDLQNGDGGDSTTINISYLVDSSITVTPTLSFVGDSSVTTFLGEKYFKFQGKDISQDGEFAIQFYYDRGMFQYVFYNGYRIEDKLWYNGNLTDHTKYKKIIDYFGLKY